MQELTNPKHVSLYIATPDIFVIQTDEPDPYNLHDFIKMHAVNENGENLDHMIICEDQYVDFTTAGDYAVYAMVMDSQGRVDSDYLIVHVLTSKEAKSYERKGTFPGLEERLRVNQDTGISEADLLDDDESLDEDVYAEELADEPTLSPAEEVALIQSQNEQIKPPIGNVFDGFLIVILLVAVVLAGWFFADMFI